MSNSRKKIFVGLSGGVDSSVSAALLKEAGHEVIGVFIKVWLADFLPCTWREERRDAMRAAAHLGIPFLTLNLENEYKKDVVDYMIKEYSAGRVPNPDVMCNKFVKFGAFLEFAKKNGADAIATGHYARVVANAEADGTSIYKLLSGIDKEKDQSYFLWTLAQNELSKTLFPIGHLQKSEVRELARKYNLPNAEKKDSQGLCFMGKVDMQEFLKHYLETKEGDVVNTVGDIIGKHSGAILYTVGQRHGFTTTKQSSNEIPYFVISKDISKNTLTVAHLDPTKTDVSQTSITISDTVRTTDTPWSGQILGRIRHRGELVPMSIIKQTDAAVELLCEKSINGIATGQSLVLYRNDECIGGGIISSSKI